MCSRVPRNGPLVDACNRVGVSMHHPPIAVLSSEGCGHAEDPWLHDPSIGHAGPPILRFVEHHQVSGRVANHLVERRDISVVEARGREIEAI